MSTVKKHALAKDASGTPLVGGTPIPKDDPAVNKNGDDSKPVESKADRFKRLANARVPAAVKRIGHVANLALRAQYEYTPEQSALLLKTLQDAVDHVKRRFAETGKPETVSKLFQ